MRESRHFFEQANANTANLDRAVGIYDQLANEATNQPHWRNQALFKKGVCLEKESDPAGALATFYRILEFNPSPDRLPEFFWFYKAGFNAARLLEEQQKWEAAAAIYEKLVAANGPRSEEASARLGQLRPGAFSLAVMEGKLIAIVIVLCRKCRIIQI